MTWQALKVGAVGGLAGGTAAWGAVPHAWRHVISVAWLSSQRVVGAVVGCSTNLIVRAIAAAVKSPLNARLTSGQASSLESSGRL